MANDRNLYGISEEEMQILLHLKKLSRLEKGKEFNAFVIQADKLDPFFKKFKETMGDFPDDTRFQLAVKANITLVTHHWFVIDCYISANKLHTFTLDAAVLEITLLPALNILNKYFPTGEHIFLHRHKRLEKAIQTTLVDCQTFTKDHISILSNIPANKLFSVLTKHATKSLPHNSDFPFITSDNSRYFSITELTKEMQILAPLLRSLQSMSIYSTLLPDAFKKQIVSKKQNLTLEKWVERYSHKIQKTTKTITQNYSIEEKDKRYKQKLDSVKNQYSSTEPHELAFGFINLPVLQFIMPYLEMKELTEIKKFIESINHMLDKDFHVKKSFLLFDIDTTPHTKIREVKNQLNNLVNKYETNDEAKLLVYEFSLVMYKFAAHLQRRSPNLFSILSDFFQEFAETNHLTRPRGNNMNK